jgi:hypothetical protein
MKTLLNEVSKTLPNFSTFDHYHSMDSFSIIRCVLSESILEMTARVSYYSIENQTFSDGGFIFQKQHMMKGV